MYEQDFLRRNKLNEIASKGLSRCTFGFHKRKVVCVQSSVILSASDKESLLMIFVKIEENS